MSEIKLLLNSLLWEIYGRIPSSISRKHRRSQQMKMHQRLYEPRLLEKLSIPVLSDICTILKLEIRLVSKYLERVLISRDKNRTQQNILYGFLDVIVSSRLGESSREMRFSLSPPPAGALKGRGDPGRPIISDETNSSSSDFNQWLHAMKMVARLPGGMPPEFRRKLWLALAEKYLKSKNVDWEKEEVKCFSEQWREDDEELGIQIVKDLHRTGSSLCSGPAGTINQAKLKRILLGYARYNPEVGYCQGFNMLGALILQVMDKEEIESIKVMIYLVEGILPRGYFSGSLGGLQADMAVFRDLMTCKLPRLAKHLQKLQGPVENAYEPPLTNVFTMQWFLTMFCTCLPMTCVLRVWDLVLIEGSDVLLRTALVLWSLLEERILSARTADDFYCKMGSFSSELLNGHLIDSNGLIEKVVDLGPIPELQKLRDKHLYNISPFRDKSGLQLYYSDDEADSDDDSRMAVATAWGLRLTRRGSAGLGNKTDGKERIALDISLLKKQYDRLRERQRQAHIILTTAVARQGSNPNQSSIQMNQLLIGRNAIVTNNGRRLGPPQGAIPPARKPSLPTAKSPKQVLTKSLRRGETLHWRDTDLSKRRRGSLKWKDIKPDGLQSGQDDRTPQLTESAPSSRSSSSEPKSQRGSLKNHHRSDSSSYSEDSDGNSSTSTSLCDEDDHEIGDTNVSSLEGSPLKKSKSSKKHSEVPHRKCLEDVLNSNDKQHTADTQIPFIQLTTMDSPVLNANKTDIDSIEYDKEDSETESNRLDYAGFVDEYSWPDMNEATSSAPLEDITVDVTSDEGDFLSLSNVITSTSQLSPIPDITTYINNSNISPLRTPISAFDYANLVVNIDDSKKFDVNDEGVTNEYFERINIVERPTKLDLLYSLNEEDSIRNAYKNESGRASPDQEDDFQNEKPPLESSMFLNRENGTKVLPPSTEELDRKMKVLLEYSNQSSLSFIAEAKHEISSGMFKAKDLTMKSLKNQPSVLVPLTKTLSVDKKPSTDEPLEHIFIVPSVAKKTISTTCPSSETVKCAAKNPTSIYHPVSPLKNKPKSNEDLKLDTLKGENETESIPCDLVKPLPEEGLQIQSKNGSKIDWRKDSIESGLSVEKKNNITSDSLKQTKTSTPKDNYSFASEGDMCNIPSTEDLETRFRALEMSFTDRKPAALKKNCEKEKESAHETPKAQISSILSETNFKGPFGADNDLPVAPKSPPTATGFVISTTHPSDVESQDTIYHSNDKQQPALPEGDKEANDFPYQFVVEQNVSPDRTVNSKCQQLLKDNGLTFSPDKPSMDEKELKNLALEETYSRSSIILLARDESVEDLKTLSADQPVEHSFIEHKSSLKDDYCISKDKLDSPQNRENLEENRSILNQKPDAMSDQNKSTAPLSHFGAEVISKPKSISDFDNQPDVLSSSSVPTFDDETHSPSQIPSKTVLELTFENTDEKCPTIPDEEQYRFPNLSYPEDHFSENRDEKTKNLDEPVSATPFLEDKVQSQLKFENSVESTVEDTNQRQKSKIPSTEDLESRYKVLERQFSEKTLSLPKDIDKADRSDKIPEKGLALVLVDVPPASTKDSDSKDKTPTSANITTKKESMTNKDTKGLPIKTIPSTAALEHRFRELERKLSSTSLSSKMTAIQQEDSNAVKQSNVKNPTIVLPNNEETTPINLSETTSPTKTNSSARDDHIANDEPPFIRKRIPSTEDLETRFEAMEIQKTLKSPTSGICNLLSPSKPKVEFGVDIELKRKSDIPSTEDLENRFEALEQSKLIQKSAKEAQNEKNIVTRSETALPSTKDLETRFEALEKRKSVADFKEQSEPLLEKKDEQVPDKVPAQKTAAEEKTHQSTPDLKDKPKAQEEKMVPSTQDLETRYEALEQRKSITENLITSKDKQVSCDSQSSAVKTLPSTKDLETRFEALEHQKSLTAGCFKSKAIQNTSDSTTCKETQKPSEQYYKKPPSTHNLEARFEALEQEKPVKDTGTQNRNRIETVGSKNVSETKKQEVEKISKVPSVQDLETRFEALYQQKSTSKETQKTDVAENSDAEEKKLPTNDLEKRCDDVHADTIKANDASSIGAQMIQRKIELIPDKQNEDDSQKSTDHNKRKELYKLESQSDETLTSSDPTSTEFDAKTESRPTSCPEYTDPFDSNIVATDRVLKIIEENSKILHRILKKTLADTGDMETSVQPKKGHPGITDSLLALGNIFPRTDETISPSHQKSHSWIRSSITLRSDDNISDRLASIKSTIKSIDTLCEEKSFRKEKCQRYIDSLFACPTITTAAAPTNPAIKIEDYECKSLQDRVPKRDLKKDTSPRRRRTEDREEYESRVRRDMMPNSLETPSDRSFSLANTESVDSEVDRINQTKQVDTQIDRPLSPYYVSGYDLTKRSITPVVYIPTKLEIRHTTVTSTFYDRYLTEKHIERTFPRSKKSPVSPTITKSYLDISKYSSNNLSDRSSKSAENSPSRRKKIDGDLSPNEAVSSEINKRNVVSTLEVAQKDLRIRSCDNILFQLRSSSNITPSIMVYNPLPTKLRKPPELGISLGLYKDYGSDESSKS